jgi:hypothetical protein
LIIDMLLLTPALVLLHWVLRGWLG